MSRKAPRPNLEASVCKYVAKYGLAAHLFYNSDGSVAAVKLSKPGLDTAGIGESADPWPTWPKPDMPDFTHMSRKVKEVIRVAKLRDELSFTSFRHGGLTETGDAELTDREILAQSRHTTVKVLPKYVKRTTNQIVTGKKRRAVRTKDGQLSE
jgi:hypothetical protein